MFQEYNSFNVHKTKYLAALITTAEYLPFTLLPIQESLIRNSAVEFMENIEIYLRTKKNTWQNFLIS